MIARLDAALPPLDPALGFYLLLAAVIGYGIARILDRARREPEPELYGEAPGDVTRRPEAR